MSQSSSEIVNHVLQLVTERNAEGDVLIAQESQLGLKCSGGELSEYKVTSSRSVGVRVIVGDQIGTSYSESSQPTDLVNMVDSAIENASYAKHNPLEKIRADQQVITDRSTEIFREDSTEQSAKIDLALSLETGLSGRDIPAKAPYNGFNEVDYEQHFGNTLGHRCSHRERSFSCYTYALLEREDQQSMHLGYQVGRRFLIFPPQPVSKKPTPRQKPYSTVHQCPAVSMMSFSTPNLSIKFSRPLGCAGLACRR